MSELMNAPVKQYHLRWHLLATVSTAVFFASLEFANGAHAATDDDRPTVWFELGGQLSQVNAFGDPFVPSFTEQLRQDGFEAPTNLESALSQDFGGEAAVSIQPEHSNWTFSAQIQYGRANGQKAHHEQTLSGARTVHFGSNTGHVTPVHGTKKFLDALIGNKESHMIVDFQVGRDVGLGLFNREATSVLSLGVRFAQFTSQQSMNLHADPDFYFPSNVLATKYHHTYAVTFQAERSFRGIGPTLSWMSSVPLLDNTARPGFNLDYGVNAALLFGRQKARGQHHTSTGYYKTNVIFNRYNSSQFQRGGSFDRSRSVVVPNLGAFVGGSFRFSNANIRLGYRADFFMNAMDTGIDARNSANVLFHGPYATISVGLGG